MIQLKSSLLWDGHLIPAGNLISLPPEMERRLVAAGNAAEITSIPKNEVEIEPLENPDSSEEPLDAEPTEGLVTPDPELKLGRGAPKVEQRLVAAGNAAELTSIPKNEVEIEHPENPDASEEPLDAESTEDPVTPDPELKLGRGAPRI